MMALLVPLEPQGRQDRMEAPVRPGRLVHQAALGPTGLMVRLACLDQQAYPEERGRLGFRALQELQAIGAPLDLQGVLEPLDPKDQRGLSAHQEIRVQRAVQALMAPLELQERLALLVTQVPLEAPAKEEQLGHQGSRVLLE